MQAALYRADGGKVFCVKTEVMIADCGTVEDLSVRNMASRIALALNATREIDDDMLKAVAEGRYMLATEPRGGGG